MSCACVGSLGPFCVLGLRSGPFRSVPFRKIGTPYICSYANMHAIYVFIHAQYIIVQAHASMYAQHAICTRNMQMCTYSMPTCMHNVIRMCNIPLCMHNMCAQNTCSTPGPPPKTMQRSEFMDKPTRGIPSITSFWKRP